MKQTRAGEEGGGRDRRERGAPARHRRRGAARRDVRAVVSFQSPLFLLALLAVPLLLAFALWIDRRRARFPVAYTNIDVLASVVEHEALGAPLGAARALPARADVRGRRARAAAHAPERARGQRDRRCSSSTSRARCAPTTSSRRASTPRSPRCARSSTGCRSASRSASSRSAPSRRCSSQPTRDRQAIRDALGYLAARGGHRDRRRARGGGEAGEALARARRRAAQAERAGARGDRAALRRRAEPRPAPAAPGGRARARRRGSRSTPSRSARPTASSRSASGSS